MHSIVITIYLFEHATAYVENSIGGSSQESYLEQSDVQRNDGSFKNALDWLKLLGDRNAAYLTDKVVGLISAAGGMQGLQAVNTMEFVVRALRGWAVPLVMPIAHAWKAFDKQGCRSRCAIDRATAYIRDRSSQRFLSVCTATADQSGRGKSRN
jgi:NADPH-dependent FMN reductase